MNWLFLYWNGLQASLIKWKYNFKNWRKKKTLKCACRFVEKLKLKNSVFSFSNFSVLLTVRMRMKRASISLGFLCNCQLTKNCVEVKRNKMWQVLLCQFRSALFYLCYFWAEWRHDPGRSDPDVWGGGTGRRPLTEPNHLRNFKKGISMPFQLDLEW